MNELVLRFPDDRHELVRMKIGGRRPYAVLVPATLDWHSIRNLEALRSAGLMTWLTVEDARHQYQPPKIGDPEVEA